MVFPVLLCLLLTYMYGCTAAPLVVQGISNAVPVAFHSTGKGKGESAWLASYDDVVQAALDAGQKLSLTLKTKSIDKDQSALNFIDLKGYELEILIERRTETLTLARFNVGLHGSTSIGRLMARQIVAELDEAGKFLSGWHPEENN